MSGQFKRIFNSIPLLGKVKHAIKDSKMVKVSISYAVIIAVGIFAFVEARKSVEQNRVEIMRSRRRIKEAREKDQEEYFRQKEETEQLLTETHIIMRK